ncbi:ATP-binding protein [Kitasatospora sp. NPDC101183]|uniref:HAMP domain-containing sensor histidine kinase n=1 Tax=Kitasatospora sp. NPDC101183 TaxID=3364100 RepID=UPI0038003C32
MIRRLIVSYVLLVGVALAAFTVPVAFTLTAQLRGDTEESVRREATTMALLLGDGNGGSSGNGRSGGDGDGDAAARQALARVARAYADETPGRVEVVAADGSAVPPLASVTRGSGDGDAALTRALREGRSTADWGSRFVWGPELVVTVPAHARDDGERIVGAVRIRYATADLSDRLWRIWGFRAVLAVGVLAVAAGLGAIVARLLTKPLRQLNDMASRFGDGDLTARSPVTGPQETRTLARTLNQGAERLDTLVASQRIFVADASHQLRTPLTALRLSLDNIADGVDDEFVREDVELATAEVVRMSRLVNGLLVLARAEAKVSVPEPVALRELVEERLGVWRAAAAERGVSVVLAVAAGAVGSVGSVGSVAEEAAGEQLSVLAGPGGLEQVLDNVLSNALEVSPDGGRITVRITVRPGARPGVLPGVLPGVRPGVRPAGDGPEGEVLLEVLDQGPGMSDAEKSRAFDRFWRGQGLTGRSGSGLGLAVVKQLVTDDGGTVALADAPGGGLSVRISLRLAQRSAQRGALSPRRGAPRSGG